MVGAPGETPETINETFAIIDRFSSLAWIWVTIGLNLWTHHQAIVEVAEKDGQLKDMTELFDEGHYISPELPKTYMLELIESLQERKNCKIQVNKLCATTT